MKLKRTFPAMLALILATLACQTLFPQADSTTPVPPPPFDAAQDTPEADSSSPGNSPPLTEDQVPRIPVSEAKAAHDSGAAIFVDTRDTEYFIQGHIKGAVSIPLDRFENSLAGIPLEENQWIITYCTWQNEHTSARAAFLLLNNGHKNVQALLGGLQAWADAGYPIEP